jgi:hypothetical protein
MIRYLQEITQHQVLVIIIFNDHYDVLIFVDDIYGSFYTLIINILICNYTMETQK